jgi:glycerol transport system ATP-binding protein
MAQIELRGVAHRYGRARKTPQSAEDEADELAVKPLDLIWEAGGAYALLGPSGCGKSTLLGIMSGLLTPSRGSVWIGGRDVTTLPPRARNVAQVFQFPVLYDTMTVFENLSFPLRNRGVPSAEIKSRVAHIAGLLELSDELQRRASGLPGELKQRVSLGRGLVRKDVAAILLDEPLTVIDPHAKWLLRRKLMEIHAELRVTLVYVTHDQLEALTLADQVVVMQDGRVLQRGTPAELFEQPEHVFVGHFIGSPGMNVLPCTIAGNALEIPAKSGAATRLFLPRLAARIGRGTGADAAEPNSLTGAGKLELGVRPEFLSLSERPLATERSAPVQITFVAPQGGFQIVRVRLGDHALHVKLPSDSPARTGETRWLEFPEAHTHLYCDGRRVA